MEIVLYVALPAIHVERTKATVIMMVNARKVTSVELIIAEVHLALNHFMIAAIVSKKIFVHLKVLVELIKVTVTLMLSVWMDLFVD